MYHSAIVSHAGHEQTRVFREVAALGAELQALEKDLLQTTPQARVALLMSWSNWWAVEDQHTPGTSIDYLAELQHYYQALWQHNCTVDIVSPEADLLSYTLVLAPLFTLVSEEQGERIEGYVEQGGTFVTTYFSGMVDEHYRTWLGGFPGPLRRNSRHLGRRVRSLTHRQNQYPPEQSGTTGLERHLYLRPLVRYCPSGRCPGIERLW